MNTSKTIAKNYLYTVLYKVVKMILPLVTIPYVTRVLGAEKLGIYDYSYSIALYFEMFAFLGFENYGSRLIAEHRKNRDELNRVFSAAYYFQLIAAVVSIGAYSFYILFFRPENADVAWIQMSMVVAELFNVSWMYFGIEKFRTTALVNIVVRIASFLGIFLFVRSREDLLAYSVLCAGTLLASSLILWLGMFKYVRLVPARIRDIWNYGKGALMLFFPVLVINIYRTMDKIMLGRMIGMAEVALYSNADKIVEVPYAILASLGVVTLPRMTRLASENEREKTNYYIEKSMRVMIFMACGMAFGMMAVGKVFAPVFFGPEFIGSGILIMVIAPHVIFRACANVVRNQYLLPQKRDKDYIVSILIGVLINLVFNSVFIPRWKAEGAAYATLMAESFVAIYQIFVCRKELPVVSYTLSNWFFVLAGFLMFVPVFLLGRRCGASVGTLALQIVLGIVLYLALAGGYLYVKEKELIRSFIRRK